MNRAEVGDLIRVIKGQLVGKIYEVIDVNVFDTVFTGDYAIYKGSYEIHRKYYEEYDTPEIVEETSVINRKYVEEDAPESVSVVEGVGPDAPIVENEFGAKQSKSPYRMDLIDAKALLEIAKVHSQGAEKYGDTNWRNISIEDNLNHALVHVYAYLAGDKQDDHLSHAATRMIFALALDLAKNNDISAK